MPGITISASYGAGGGTVAPEVARRLGWAFVDRAITASVAERVQLPVEDVEAGGAQDTWLTRLLLDLAPMAEGSLDAELPLPSSDQQVREAMEEALRGAVRRAPGAVVLGRAGACALLEEPDVLRVRLYGPVPARPALGAALGGVDPRSARRRQRQVDAARDGYVRRLYHRSADDAALYHLQLDSTAIPLAACVELVLAAWRAHATQRHRPAP